MTIVYTEKGAGLHAAINTAGHWLRQEGAAWIASDEEAVQAIINGYGLAHTKEDICRAIDRHAGSLREQAVGDTSFAEMAGWPIKKAEALAYQSSRNAADAPLLALEAQARGVDLALVVERVLLNAERYMSLEARIAGIAGKHKDAVRLAPSYEAALSYPWEDFK